MIYVMRSTAFKSDGGYETIIKIGYTGEKSHKARFDLYLTENPTIKVLYLIPFGTTRDEKNLHRHFKQYLLYSNEWFKDVPEIIEFFDNHKTKESLKELEKWKLSIPQKRKSSENRRDNKDKISLINLSINIILKGELDRERIKELENYLWYRLDDFWDVIREEFGEYEEEIKREIERINSADVELNELQQTYDYLVSEFDKDKDFVRRMKLLCDIYFQFPDFYIKYTNSPLQCIIPIEYQNYINLLGFERIRALSYKEIEIQREIETINRLKSIDINSIFSVGSKYSKAQIKEMLREFYIVNSISKTPKASDLEDYFILKTCKVKNSDGKWENGFEIISLK